MSRFLRIWLGFCALSVNLLQQSRVCWAAETTQQGVAATVLAGAGKMVDSNNEGDSDAYDVRRLGFGVTGVLRGTTPRASASQHASGFFALAGVAAELEWAKQTWCGASCDKTNGIEGPLAGPFEQASKVGLRAGVGYSFSLVEFRVGVLHVMPSSDSAFPESFTSPDVMLRLGRRSLGWFELGLGAYDASTVLRPGAYLGGGGGRVEELRVTGHLGVHVVNGMCCQSLVPFGGIAELDVEHAVSRSVVAGVDFKLEAATSLVFATSFHLAFML